MCMGGEYGRPIIKNPDGSNQFLTMVGIPKDQQRGSDAFIARENAWKEFKQSATDAQLSGDWSNFSGTGGGLGATQQLDPNIKSNLQTRKTEQPKQPKPAPQAKKKKPPTTGGGGLQVPDAGMSAGTGGLNV